MQKNDLYTQFNSVFFEKTRISIMTLLYKEKSVSFNRMKNILKTSDGAIYAHLQKLQDAGYITPKKEIIGGNAQTVYSLNKEGEKVFKKYIDFLEDFIKDIKIGDRIDQ